MKKTEFYATKKIVKSIMVNSSDPANDLADYFLREIKATERVWFAITAFVLTCSVALLTVVFLSK